ncbi:hypothetical protein [Domibacillus iocasae]|nr:hypothetical protein [Domibacillus iocasae]
MYVQVYNEEMPVQSYTKQDIHYIIQLLQQTILTGQNGLQPGIIH